MAKVIVVGGRREPEPNMGGYLVEALRALNHEVVCVLRSKEVWIPEDGGWHRSRGLMKVIKSEDEIAEALDEYINGVEVLFLATPANPAVELAYIKYCLKHSVHVITLAKGALAHYWKELKPHLHAISRYATVGGRALPLPWLKLQQLPGKRFIMYAYLNASTNYFMDGTSRGASPQEMFRTAKALRLAEPGATDYVSFLNNEIGGDYPLKLCIAYNEGVASEEGPFITPAAFDKYVPLSASRIRELTLPTEKRRFMACIFNVGSAPFKVKRGAPGTLYARFGKYTIIGGFCDISRDVHLAHWVQGEAANGVKIVFQDGGHNETGTVELAGPGAGPDTVWSAIINMNEYLARQKQLGGQMQEVLTRARYLPQRPAPVAPAPVPKGKAEDPYTNELLGGLRPGGG